ncbi:hypothetical protein [Paenibacillus jiagnxiensis]|uniref:hypothetical protein n=1 Tax=Paenibacillus jiagnxiensis TaxID=3228926 RepID=UPI0033B05167
MNNQKSWVKRVLIISVVINVIFGSILIRQYTIGKQAVELHVNMTHEHLLNMLSILNRSEWSQSPLTLQELKNEMVLLSTVSRMGNNYVFFTGGVYSSLSTKLGELGYFMAPYPDIIDRLQVNNTAKNEEIEELNKLKDKLENAGVQDAVINWENKEYILIYMRVIDSIIS